MGKDNIDHSMDDYLAFRIKDMEAYKVARAKIDDADSLFDDLPDGAYWAACEEFGAGQDLQLAVDTYERENKLGLHAPDFVISGDMKAAYEYLKTKYDATDLANEPQTAPQASPGEPEWEVNIDNPEQISIQLRPGIVFEEAEVLRASIEALMEYVYGRGFDNGQWPAIVNKARTLLAKGKS